MKKFLSLVLALVMTMSLVTISAGATEYKDLTDKDEIQYEEAVAVLNRIGIITGYEDGSFRPETELTRGAAAKIIVSLMIGPEAASALPNNESPYPDVPAGHTFAGVIGYCKTAGYISGYGDGTFKPANSLTGYAFAKMLLGALGYKSNLEGFTGTGWTMNVARLGNAAGLFNRLSFQGADAVNREEACQLALNTLKATMVEYTGGFNVTAGDATVVGAQTRTYVTSNQAYAKNIDNRKAENQGNAKDQHYTVEFGEEHFKDLRLDDDHEQKNDSFGRPSNVWSYKKVTIGTFPIAPDYVFDKQMAFADKSDAVKNRATGLGGFDLDGTDSDGNAARTTFWVNGTKFELDNDGKWKSAYPATQDTNKTNILAGKVATVANICDLTDNGTVVEVYVSEDDADFISDVVVVKTQLMEVKKVGSDYVSLQMYDNGTSADVGKTFQGFNAKAINEKVANVQAEDAGYSVLKDLKTGDRVAVIPVDPDHDGKDFEVAKAYVPETVSGTLTAVADYGDSEKTKNAISVTVGGTVYNISLWNKDLNDIDGEKIKVTRKDVTLTLDEHGNALLAEDVGATNDFMVVGAFRSGVENGRIVTYVTGWDISGSEVELNLGPNFSKDASSIRPGDLVKYSSNSRSNITDWTISETDGVYNVWTGFDDDTTGDDPYEIKASNVKINLRDYDGDDSQLYIDKGIKFIYVTFDIDGEVESIEVKKEVQNVENKELRTTGANYNNQLGVDGGVIPYAADGDSVAKHISNYNSAQAAVKSDAIKAVVIKQESNDAISSAMLYVRDMPGGAEYDKNGKLVYKYTVAMNGKDGLVDDEMTIYSYDRLYRGDFASYAEMENENYEKTPFYSLRQHNDFVGRTTSTFQADILNIVNVNKGLVELGNYKGVSEKATLSDTPNIGGSHKATLGLGDEINIASIKNAVFVDMTKNDIDSYDDLKTFMFANRTTGDEEKVRQSQVQVQLVANDNTGNDGFRRVAMVIVTDEWAAPDNTKAGADVLTSISIKGATVAVPTNGTEATPNTTPPVAGSNHTASVTLTHQQASGSAPIRFSHNGDKIKVELSTDSGVTYAELANSTRTLDNGDMLKVKVTAINGNSNTYVFTVTVTPLSYLNSTSEDYKTLTGYSAGDWNDGDDVVVGPGSTFNFPFLNTGDREDTEAQILEAIQYYNLANPDEAQISESFKYLSGGLWQLTLDGTPLTFDESTATKVLAGVDDGTGNVTWDLYAANAQLGTGLSMTASTIAKEVNTDSETVWHETLTDVVTPGSVYTDGVGAKLTTGTETLHDLFDVAYTVGNKTVKTNDILEAGDKVTITLTAKADITLDNTGTALKVAFSAAGDANPSFSGDSNAVGTPTDATKDITFKNNQAATVKVAEGDTIVLEITLVKATHCETTKAITLPNITVTPKA